MVVRFGGLGGWFRGWFRLVPLGSCSCPVSCAAYQGNRFRIRNPCVEPACGCAKQWLVPAWFRVGSAWFRVCFHWFLQQSDWFHMASQAHVQKQGETRPSLIRLGRVVSLDFKFNVWGRAIEPPGWAMRCILMILMMLIDDDGDDDDDDDD